MATTRDSGSAESMTFPTAVECAGIREPTRERMMNASGALALCV